jgi:hypothetical protein
LLRLLLSRLVLAAIPFLVYFAWRGWVQRRGGEAKPPPWGWLIAVAAVLVGLSIILSVALTPSNLGRKYVPAETQSNGSVTPGRYE